MPYYNRDPKRDPNFDNHPNKILVEPQESPSKSLKGLGFRVPFTTSPKPGHQLLRLIFCEGHAQDIVGENDGGVQKLERRGDEIWVLGRVVGGLGFRGVGFRACRSVASRARTFSELGSGLPLLGVSFCKWRTQFGECSNPDNCFCSAWGVGNSRHRCFRGSTDLDTC